MTKKVINVVKLRIPIGAATPAPPVGPALGQAGINITGFTKDLNAGTADREGMIIPAVTTVYEDRSFEFITKTPPAAVLLKKAAKVEKSFDEPSTKKIARVTKARVREIAETKIQDLDAADVEAAMHMVEGTARNIGFEVED